MKKREEECSGGLLTSVVEGAHVVVLLIAESRTERSFINIDVLRGSIHLVGVLFVFVQDDWDTLDFSHFKEVLV